MSPEPDKIYQHFLEEVSKHIASPEKVADIYNQAAEAERAGNSDQAQAMLDQASRLKQLRLDLAELASQTNPITQTLSKYDKDKIDLPFDIRPTPIEETTESIPVEVKEDKPISTTSERKRTIDIFKEGGGKGEILQSLLEEDEKGNWKYRTGLDIGKAALKDEYFDNYKKYQVRIYQQVKDTRLDLNNAIVITQAELFNKGGYVAQTMDDPFEKIENLAEKQAYKKISYKFGDMAPEDFRVNVLWRGRPPVDTSVKDIQELLGDEPI